MAFIERLLKKYLSVRKINELWVIERAKRFSVLDFVMSKHDGTERFY